MCIRDSPYPLLRAIEALAEAGYPAAPEQCVYVGDAGDDMLAARAAGMIAVGFVPPYLPAAHADTLRSQGAHTVLTGTLDGLPDALMALA